VEKRARLSLYLPGEKISRQIKVAAAKRGMSISNYCVEAIEERLIRDGELSVHDTQFAQALPGEYQRSLIKGMDSLREEIGTVDIPVTELIKEGRKR